MGADHLCRCGECASRTKQHVWVTRFQVGGQWYETRADNYVWREVDGPLENLTDGGGENEENLPEV